MRKYFLALLLLALAVTLVPMGNSQPANRDLARLMKDKLKSAQVLMEGMALADFAKIRRSADELIQISKTEEWMVYKTPRYQVHSNDFRRAVETIYQKAKDQNIDGVALAYVDMTLSCVRCHQYVRELREAKGPLNPRPVPYASHGN